MIDRPEDRENEQPEEPGTAGDSEEATETATASKTTRTTKATKAAKADADEDDAPSAASSSTAESAVRLREMLTARKEAEQLRGEASRMWEEAAEEAERMVTQAQDLVKQLVDEAKSEAQLRTSAAEAHAAALTAGAEQEAIRLRRQVEEEVMAVRMRSEAAMRVRMDEVRQQVRETVELGQTSVLALRARLEESTRSIEQFERNLKELSVLADREVEIGDLDLSEEPPVSAPPALAVPEVEDVERAPAPSLADQAVVAAAPATTGASVVIEPRQDGRRHGPRRGGAGRTVRPKTAHPETSIEQEQPGDGTAGGETVDGRPLGWLFRAP